MSVEEDTELRNLVAETLENKGILPKIRAELRASIFLALEENISARETLLKNEELSAFVQIPVGILILNLVREFLEFFNLDFTLSVFDPETKYGKDYNSIAREKMIKELNITGNKEKGPLLYEIISKIVSDFKDGQKSNFKNEKNVFTLNLSHCDVSLNGDAEAISPVPHLNTTFVKSKEGSSSTPLDSPNLKDESGENDSVEEELVADKLSASGNSSNEVSSKNEPVENTTALSQEYANDKTVFKQMPENSSEFDLLKFTPVKEVKTKEKSIPEPTDKKEIEEKTRVNSMSVLGDLPPLNGKTEGKMSKMNEIKAIIDQGLNQDNYDDDDFHSSLSSKGSNARNEESGKYNQSPDQSQNVDNASDKSGKTDIVEEENIEDELIDLINTQNSVENLFTIEETVSKLSDIADHLESL